MRTTNCYSRWLTLVPAAETFSFAHLLAQVNEPFDVNVASTCLRSPYTPATASAIPAAAGGAAVLSIQIIIVCCYCCAYAGPVSTSRTM